MIFGLFYYTLIVMLVTVLASAACMSVYLVSHKRSMLFAFLGFLFYFFDVALVLQNDFAGALGLADVNNYQMMTSLLFVVTGLGFIGSFWLLVCDFIGDVSLPVIVAPPSIFVLSCAFILMMPTGDNTSFCFFTMRELFMYWILAYIGFRYFTTKNDILKSRMRKYRRIYVVLLIMTLCILVEDIIFFLYLDPLQITFGPRSLSINRNFSENVMMLVFIAYTCRAAIRTLNLRFETPPKNLTAKQEANIGDDLSLYARRYKLSGREQEILAMVLEGKDNQNIASELSLSPSTIKVHVHNILQKTSKANRGELTQDFWNAS